MRTMKIAIVLLACIALLLLVGCAVSPETNERRLAVEAEIDAILSQPLPPEFDGIDRSRVRSLDGFFPG